MNSVAVAGTKLVGGHTATVFSQSNPYGSGIALENYYYKNAGGVAFLGTNDATDTLTAGLIPYIVALFPVSPGVVAHFDKNGLDFGHDLDGDGISETVNLTLSNTIVDFESVSIGIGSFARTVKSDAALDGSVVLSRSRTSVPFSLTQTTWSAPGVGRLKISESTTLQSTTSSQTAEARGYSSNGVVHGFGLPFTVATDLAAGDSNYYNPGPAALTTDGQNFLAVSANSAGISGMLFDSQGTPISSVGLTGEGAPVAAFDGSNFWVVNSDSNGCHAQRVSPTGTLVDTSINLVTVSGTFSAATCSGFRFGDTDGLVAFSVFNGVTNQHELHGVFVNSDGSTSREFPIATDDSTHVDPTVAFDGTNFFVAWTGLPSSGATVGSIYGTRVSPAGSVIDPAPIAIATAPNGQYSPSVAFDGTNYLIVWLDSRSQIAPTGVPYPDVYGARVTTDGVLLDGPATTGGFPINSGGTLERYSPYVAFTGTEYLVTWTSLGYANTGSPGVQAARVSTSGALPSGVNMAITVSGPPTAATFSQFVFPVIAAGPRQAMVVWLDNRELSGSQKALLGAGFSPF